MILKKNITKTTTVIINFTERQAQIHPTFNVAIYTCLDIADIRPTII